jgi:hypothetical protein
MTDTVGDGACPFGGIICGGPDKAGMSELRRIAGVKRSVKTAQKNPPFSGAGLRPPRHPALWPQIAGMGLILLAGQLCWMRGCDKQHPTTVR